MMWAEDGGVSGQVLKVVHDDSHEQIQHLKTQTVTLLHSIMSAKQVCTYNRLGLQNKYPGFREILRCKPQGIFNSNTKLYLLKSHYYLTCLCGTDSKVN